jgi:hypothetical protein
MAQIDPSIALSIRPAQIESPLVHAARAAELQGAQQSQFMNMLKMKEYVDESRTKNNMMKWLADKPDLNDDKNLNTLATQFGPQGLALAKQIDDRRKAQGEAEYRQAQITDLKSQGVKRDYDINKSRTEDAIKTISGFTNRQQALDMLYQSEANGTIPREAAENIRRMIPDNEEEFPAFKQDLMMRLASPDERLRQSNREEDRDAPKPEKFELGGKIVTRDMNPRSKTYLQTIATDEKTAAPAAVVESPLAKLVREKSELTAKDPNSPMLKIYDDAIGKETGGAPPALVQEYLYAQKNNGFKGTLLDFKKQVAMAGRNVTNNAAPVQTVTVMGPDGKPELRDARTGRRITDDQGKPLVPFDASTKPLSPVQELKLRKDRTADNSKIVAAKDMADDVEKNVDVLLGNPDKKIPRHPGYKGITGYNALLPSLPGGDARSAQQLLENIKGKVTVLGKNLASQEGKIGPMAVQEWKIVADALERIDPAAANFPDQLRSIAAQARRLETNLKARNAELYPAAPSSSGNILNEADAVLKGQ